MSGKIFTLKKLSYCNVVSVNSNRIAKNDVSKVFESPYDSRSFEVGDDILKLCRGKYVTYVHNGMGVFTLFSLHEYNTNA